MARARNIKPSFFKNEDLADQPYEARLLFIGLWTLADREGRLKDRPKRIKMEIFPGDSVDVDRLLQKLHDAGGFIHRYPIGEKRYIQIINFKKHQAPHWKEADSTIPEPPAGLNYFSGPAAATAACARRRESMDDAQQRGQHTEEEWGELLVEYAHRCARCYGNSEPLTKDHVVPISQGGSDSIANLQPLCQPCNSWKGTRTMDFRVAMRGEPN